ncbi:hypothetical protein [Dactylosporangium sp. NPDC049140]|uniref:hypothetical protein n=1 Tax=Dactylosporangium sp. NPDC049140 TaxID=3155647 RepID=UPI0033FF360A
MVALGDVALALPHRGLVGLGVLDEGTDEVIEGDRVGLDAGQVGADVGRQRQRVELADCLGDGVEVAGQVVEDRRDVLLGQRPGRRRP